MLAGFVDEREKLYSIVDCVCKRKFSN